MFIKKAAMFGLDARIALAIFGALSVISGAALYSAIQQAQNEKWRQYFENLIKASEAYYIDNAQHRSFSYASYQELKDGLGANSENLSTWKGPYFQVTNSYFNGFRDPLTYNFSIYAYVKFMLRKGGTWAEMNDRNSDELCVVGSNDCFEWITFSAANDPVVMASLSKIFNNLDEYVDGGDGPLDGTVRFSTDTNGGIMYKGLRHIRPS